MESKNFIEATILVRPHQLSNLYQFAGQLADNADMAFDPEGPHLRTVSAASGGPSLTGKREGDPSRTPAEPVASKEPAKPAADKQPDGPPQSIKGAVDPAKFSGCRNVNEVVTLIWNDNGLRDPAEIRAAFDQVRASGACQAAAVIPEESIEKRVSRAITMLQAE